jgi:ribonuclease PH
MQEDHRMTRQDGRGAQDLRPVTIEVGLQRNPEGSVLYRCGGTTVLLAASVMPRVPDWLAGSGGGWVTAEYAMHPRANPDRQTRDGRRGRVDGRSQEIQRLVGRALRSAVALDRLGERAIMVDCDVLDADGGTRTASITGGWVALAIALDGLRRRGLVGPGVLRAPVAAISVGLVEGRPLLDLCYEEDRDAAVDLNVVGTPEGAIVEVQGTAEGAPIARTDFDTMLDVAMGAMPTLGQTQRRALESAGVELDRLVAP